MTDPQAIAAQVAEFGKAYGRWINSELEQTGTTPARGRLLLALGCAGPCKMSDLSARLGVTPRNVTKLVDSLEEEGLLEREPHPHDRRVTLIRLTAQGVVVNKETMLANSAAAGIYQDLSATDRRHLSRILEQLIQGLHARGF